MKAIGYLRVSTSHQAESGLGLEAQEIAIQRFCDQTGLQLCSVHQDAAVSGKSALSDRIGLMRAIAEMKEKDIKYLVVYRMDRLSRSMMISLGLEQTLSKFGGRVLSCNNEGTENDDASSVMMRRIFQATGEYESAVISARVSAAMNAAKERGQPVGRLPLGFERVSKTEWTTNHLFNQVAAVLWCKINRYTATIYYPNRVYFVGGYPKERRRWTAPLVAEWMNENQTEVRWTAQKVRNIWKRYNGYQALTWVAPYNGLEDILEAKEGYWKTCKNPPSPVS